MHSHLVSAHLRALLLALCLPMAWSSVDLDVTALMPARATTEEDSYLCTIVPLPENQSLQLVEFTPLAEASRVHHMLLFGA